MDAVRNERQNSIIIMITSVCKEGGSCSNDRKLFFKLEIQHCPSKKISPSECNYLSTAMSKTTWTNFELSCGHFSDPATYEHVNRKIGLTAEL